MDFKKNWESVFARVKTLPPTIVAIECRWDGDSSGWYVDVLALEETASETYKTHHLAGIGHGLGEIYDFNRAVAGVVPPYPEGQAAQELGEAIASQLGVPFYFPSPDKPALDEVPCWVDWRVGRTSSIPIRMIDPEPLIEQFSGKRIAVIEAYWDYYHTFFPKMCVVTLEDSDDGQPQFRATPIGALYWDEGDSGRVIYGQHIPSSTPVEEAVRIGNYLAGRLNAPFYFASPDKPSHNDPRWIALQKRL